MSDSDTKIDETRAGDAPKSIGEGEAQLQESDPVAEGKLVRKLDLHLVPVVMLLYLLSFLDR